MMSSEQKDPEKGFDLVLNDVGDNFFSSRHAARRQKNYLHYHLAMTDNFTLREFVARLRQLNEYLPYGKKIRKFDDDELVDILDWVKPLKWQSTLLASNLDPHDLSWEDTVDYFEKLEVRDNIDCELAKSKTPKESKKSCKREQTEKNSDRNNNGSNDKCQPTHK